MRYWLGISVLLMSLSGLAQESFQVDRPWNGYWWPFQEGALVTGNGYLNHPSAMEKYDAVFEKGGRAVRWELANHYDSDGELWWGHCNGWASASILEPEPHSPIRSSYINFQIGELKGLLTEAYQSSYGSMYGHRNSGSGDYSDINPLLFQQVLQLYIRDNQLPILVDTDAGVEIWTYPIYKYDLSWVDEGELRHVTCIISCATDGVSPDSDLTIDYIKTYTYDLEKDGNGDFVSGEWTGESVLDHPDFLWYPDFPASGNPFVLVGEVRQLRDGLIPAAEDDNYEPNDAIGQAVSVWSNSVFLSANSDWFEFEVEPYQKREVSIGFNDTGYNGSCTVWNGPYQWLQNLVLDPETKTASFNFGAGSQDFRWLEVPFVADFPCNYLLTTSVSSYTGFLGHVDMNPYWQMTAMLIAKGSESVEGQILAFSKDIGLQSVGDPKTFSPNRYEQVTSMDLPVDTQWMKVNSMSGGVGIRALYASRNGLSLGIWEDSIPETDFYLPHVPENLSYWWYGLTMLNTSSIEKATVNLTAYDHEGKELGKTVFILDPYEKKVGLYEELFPSIPVEALSFFEGHANVPMVVNSLYGTRDHNELTYVNISGQPLKGRYWLPLDLLDSPEPWYGIALVNPGDVVARLRLNWYLRGDYKPSYTETRYIGPKMKLLSVVKELLPETLQGNDWKFLEINVDSGTLQGLSLAGDHGVKNLTGLSFLPAYKSGEVLSPVTIKGINCQVYVTATNCNDYGEYFVLTLHDVNGNELISKNVLLSAHDRVSSPLTNWFSSKELETGETVKIVAGKGVYAFICFKGNPGLFEMIGEKNWSQ